MKKKLAMRIEPENCLEVKSHTKAPESYLAYAAWAEEKSKTHDVKVCHGCQRYVIWKKIK